MIVIAIPENVFHSMTGTKIDKYLKAQANNLPTDLGPMTPEQIAFAVDHVILSFPTEFLRQPIQPTPAMWPTGIEHQVEAHQINDTTFHLSLISINNVLMNSGTSRNIFTGWLKQLLGQLRDLLLKISSFH